MTLALLSALVLSQGGPCRYRDFGETCVLARSTATATARGQVTVSAVYRVEAADGGLLAPDDFWSGELSVEIEAPDTAADKLREWLGAHPRVPCSGSIRETGSCVPWTTHIAFPKPSGALASVSLPTTAYPLRTPPPPPPPCRYTPFDTTCELQGVEEAPDGDEVRLTAVYVPLRADGSPLVDFPLSLSREVRVKAGEAPRAKQELQRAAKVHCRGERLVSGDCAPLRGTVDAAAARK